MTRRRLAGIVTPLVAVLLSIVVGGLLVAAIGENPLKVYGILFRGALGSIDGIGYVLFSACPLIFTGLAVAFTFRAGLFNIGAEGQLYIGTFALVWAALELHFLPPVLMIPLLVIMAAIGGALWGAIPGYLKARFGVHEVINTIMMNFIAIGLTSYLVINVYKEPGQMTPQTSAIPHAAEIPRMSAALGKIGIDFPETNPLNVSIFLAILCVFLVQFILTRTTFGYRVRAVGLNARAAEYAGINVFMITLGAMAVSGALAGLVGVNEAMGFRHRFLDNFSTGLGFMGIAVALLGRNNPFGALAAAILFGILNTGALEIDVFTDVPRELILVLQAVIIILVVVVNQLLMWQFERAEKRRLIKEGGESALLGSC